jgi:outer membrane protein
MRGASLMRAGALALVTCLYLSTPWALSAEEAPSGPGVEVGSPADLDLEEVRRVIETTERSALVPSGARQRQIDLEEAVLTALRHNLSLEIARLDVDAAAHEVPATRARFHPTPGLTFVATEERTVDRLSFSSDPRGQRRGTESVNTQFGQAFVRQELPTGGEVVVASDLFREVEDPFSDAYEGGAQLELRQPLMRGGRIYVATREIQDAEFDLGVLEAELQAQILQVTSDATQAYYNTVLAARLIDVSVQAVARDQQLIEASTALFEAGRGSKRDVVSAEIRLSDDLADLARRHGALERTQLVLRDVLGLPIGEDLIPAEPTVPFRPIQLRLEHWIDQALTRRPEMRGVQVRLEQSALNVQVATNTVLPKLDAVGAFRRHDFAPSSRRAWGFDSQTWAAGVEFEIPFGNVAARERLQSARFLHRRVERELENLSRAIEIEVRNEVIGLRQNLEDLKAQAAKVEQSRSKLEIAQVRFERGLANNLDITDSQSDLVDAESALLVAIVDYTNGIARLEATVAGPL